MFIKEDDAFHIAHLFQFLIQGEELALACSKRQSEITVNPVERQFFLKQCRQEKFHSAAFKFGSSFVRPKGIKNPIGQRIMSDYRQLIFEALVRGDIAESVLGMQVILEGLGDVTIENMRTGIATKRAAYERIRQLILSQEDEHHDFGLNYFSHEGTEQPEITSQLTSRAQDYLGLTEALLLETQSLFEYFEADVNQYRHRFFNTLPDWVTSGGVTHK